MRGQTWRAASASQRPATLTDPRNGESIGWVRASEVGEYAFCARAWWLGRLKLAPHGDEQGLFAGVREHNWHRRKLTIAIWSRRVGLDLLALAVIVAMYLWLQYQA